MKWHTAVPSCICISIAISLEEVLTFWNGEGRGSTVSERRSLLNNEEVHCKAKIGGVVLPLIISLWHQWICSKWTAWSYIFPQKTAFSWCSCCNNHMHCFVTRLWTGNQRSWSMQLSNKPRLFAMNYLAFPQRLRKRRELYFRFIPDLFMHLRYEYLTIFSFMLLLL